MSQKPNRILDIINQEWAYESVRGKNKIAVLQEENERLKAEIENLKKDTETNSAE